MLIKKRKKGTTEIFTSSMADIAFLLMIFFLVTTTIDMDKGINLTLPEKGGEQVKIKKGNIANLLVNAAGQILLDNEPIDVTQIQELIKQKIEEKGYDKDGKPILIVSIQTARDTDYNTYIQVLDNVKVAGATKISIAEPEK
ncbi:biopolymer transporter ExbD [candidate division LCP-89 bacterium B3_LCP]|uniref:Biopolymer transporter ExbD n=1 Tax=candidate division LCP-89 bacterium B3_LCP TaxID=2012998 RepID=A0A532UXU4_UNCL8|nr:MAG: biopolymer transporter ExbD [candidate division LCP-89 bacterium B3_LCP]